MYLFLSNGERQDRVNCFPLQKFRQFTNNSISYAEMKRFISYENFYPQNDETKIFQGNIDFPFIHGG